VPPVLGSHVLLPCPQGKGTQKNKTKLFRRKNNFKPQNGSWKLRVVGGESKCCRYEAPRVLDQSPSIVTVVIVNHPSLRRHDWFKRLCACFAHNPASPHDCYTRLSVLQHGSPRHALHVSIRHRLRASCWSWNDLRALVWAGLHAQLPVCQP
jgi:hypothetical protein